MNLMDRLRGLFSRRTLPDDTRALFQEAHSTREVLKGLDDLLTRNELEHGVVNKEIAALEAREQAEIARVRAGDLPPRQKRNALLAIQRLRKQMDNLENRLAIYDKNMNLHINLIGKIQDMEAMQLKGVDEQDIDRVVEDFEEHFESWMNSVTAGEAATEAASRAVAQDEAEIARLEREVVGDLERGRIERKRSTDALEAEVLGEPAGGAGSGQRQDLEAE
ncbi:MAG: hypothetical protein HY722_09515 [Planctomycetes bacterium]|nr:hypothetical protein [Planctomycetota bacterium]